MAQDFLLPDLDPLIPKPAKPGPVIKYGTVTQQSPLKVLVDGDTVATDVNDACLPLVGQRVVMILQNRILTAVAALDVDTGWLTTGYTVSSGWSVTLLKYRRIGKLVYVYLNFDRTGADLGGGASGNMANTPVATLPAGFRPSTACVLSTGTGGSLAGGYIDNAGIIYMAATVPNQPITSTGPTCSLGGMFPLD